MNAKFKLSIIFHLVICFNLQAQDEIDINRCPNIDTSEAKTFEKVVHSQFTSVLNGGFKNEIGTFAAVDIKDSKLTFNGTIKSSKGFYVSLKTEGAVTDGIYSVFNNSKLNTNLSCDLQFHFLNPAQKKFSYECGSYIKALDNIDRAEKSFTMQKKFLESRIAHNYTLIEKIKKELLLPEISEENKLDQTLKIDSLVLVMSTDSAAKNDLSKKKRAAIKEAKAGQFKVMGINFGWFSLNYKVNSKFYKLFNPDTLVAQQVTRNEFVGHQVGFQYNYYRWHEKNNQCFDNFFIAIGGYWALDDNQTDLTSIEITDLKNYTLVNAERTSSKKYTVYQGDYSKNLNKVVGFIDFFYFLFKDNGLGIHINPNTEFKDKSKPRFNATTGLLYSFNDSKDESGKSKVNVEVFYNFNDLSNNGGVSKSLFERNTIGMRFVFPIKFKVKE